MSNADHVALLGGLTAVEATFLLILLALVRPPTDPTAEGKPGGFVRTYGVTGGWVICFGVLFALTAVAVTPGLALLATAGWWLAALMLFGLTARQTFKVNIAMGLLTLATVLAVAAAGGD